VPVGEFEDYAKQQVLPRSARPAPSSPRVVAAAV
jgi:hypothetical protein